MINEIKIVTLDNAEFLTVNKLEAMRYLGVKECDEIIDNLYSQCLEAAQNVSEPRAAYIEADITVNGEVVDFGFMRVNSSNLAKNLCDCRKAYVFCATLGIGMDRQYGRISKISQAKASMFSAVGSAMIESFCDYVNDILREGIETKPRFSCGYGDFCIEHQREILNILEASKHLGICLTETYMMVPVKSVTAIIGIRR